MFQKTLATLLAVLIALGLSLTTSAAALADSTLEASESAALPAAVPDPAVPDPAVPDSAEPDPIEPRSSDPASSDAGSSDAAQTERRHTAPPQSPTLYGVAIYVYKKTDPSRPASWQNSGLQTLVASTLGRTSMTSNIYYSSLTADHLPAGVCGSGWGVQQDKVRYQGTFTFPTNIQYPVDDIGWPPLYDARHDELRSYLKVPACPPATAAVVVTDATCSAPATVALGSIENATFGTLRGATGPGRYSVTATALPGYTFADGSTTSKLTGTLGGTLPASHRHCAPPPPPPCLRSSSVSYSYDPATNSGAITVAPGASPASRLCRPFFVTAAAWRFLDTDQWPQQLDGTQKLGPISAPGVYAFGMPVTCGQGDIYASYAADDPTLSPTAMLFGPDNPFDEKFLHQMGFRGPSPTYVVQTNGCNELTVGEPTQQQPECQAAGSYTIPVAEHVRWTVNGAPAEPGTYPARPADSVTIVAHADAGWTLPDGVLDSSDWTWSTSWTFVFHAPEGECATLAGSTAVAECLFDVPWITYTLVLTDPYDDVTSRDATLTMAADGQSVTLPLGTIPASGTLTGTVLWPGAQVDPVTDEATGWPGWVQLDGVWQPTSDPAYFGWTRDVTSATIQVNPELVVAISYPPATPDCATRPPHDPPAVSSLAVLSLAQTGTETAAPTSLAILLVLAGAAVIAATRRPIRRRR